MDSRLLQVYNMSQAQKLMLLRHGISGYDGLFLVYFLVPHIVRLLEGVASPESLPMLVKFSTANIDFRLYGQSIGGKCY